jgi:pimeloyl-ACP methyl ester carboxylesterase
MPRSLPPATDNSDYRPDVRVHRRLLAVLLSAAAVVAGCTGAGNATASMTIEPAAGPLDEPVSVSVRGLPAGARTTVTATATDATDERWSSSADFRATAEGTVSLDQAPAAGSYSGADPMGLFQFMTPADAGTESYVWSASGSYEVTLAALVDGRQVATATARRLTPQELGVTAEDLRVARDGVDGALFRPGSGAARRSAVLVFGGSEGGLSWPVRAQAALLAAHGYPSLALAYFRAPGLPQTLTAVPLEYFGKALTRLRSQRGVDPGRVFVMGTSRGGEAALLLGSYLPQLVDGVIAQVPTSYVNAAFPAGSRSAWTLAGRDLPHAGTASFGAPAASVDPRTLIPVERIRGPILLTCGQLDLVWPSCPNVEDITRRLSSRRFPHPVTALRYPDAGHYASVIPPYASITDDLLTTSGGSVPGTQAASVEIHSKVLALLAGR